MTAEGFAAARTADWQALEALLAAGRPSAAERRRLAALYRVALADLGQLRTLAARDQIAPLPLPAIAWLNGLVARAHARVALHRRGSAVDIPEFFAATLPRAVRRALPRIGVAALLLLGSALVSYLLCRNDLALAQRLAGPAMSRNAEGFAQLGKGRAESVDAAMAAFYVTNNVQVAFVAFALGITLGIGTLFIMIQNGLILGVTLALVRHHGSLVNFFAFISSHGFIELSAILIAAGAGLGMGRAVAAPGPYRRAVALKLAAREAATLVMGAACLLLIAAFFEAFVSPSSWRPGSKLAIGLANLAWLSLYVGLAGKRKRDPAAGVPFDQRRDE